MFKLKLKKSEVDDLDDVKVIEESTSGYNRVQTIFDKNGERKVFFYKWTEYLKKIFKQLIGVSEYHHFIFTQENPGIVLVKKQIDSELKIIDISKDLNAEPELEQKFPAGLTAERRNYLSGEISKLANLFKILLKKNFILIFNF